MTESLVVDIDHPAPGVLLLKPDGALDLPTAANLRRAYDRAVGEVPCPTVVVDLERVAFLGSAGVAVLLDIAESAKGRGGRLALVRPSPPAARVLGLLRLERELPVHGSVQEALSG